MVREDETLVLDLLVAAAEHNAPAAWNPSLPATLRVNLPQTLGTTADVEGTLLAWIDAGTSLTVSFRRRRGVHLVQLSHEDTDITLQVEQTAQLH